MSRFDFSELLVEYIPDKKALGLLAGLYLSSIRGDGIEFDSARLYAPGDDPRAILWSKLAQTGNVYSKLFCEEREVAVYIAIDPSPSMSWARTIKASCIIATIRLLAFSVLANRDRLGLVIGSQESDQSTFIRAARVGSSLEYGELLVQKASRFLEYNRMMQIEKYDQKRSGIGLHELLFSLLNRADIHKSLIFLISDFIDFDEEAQSRCTKLSMRADVIPIQILDIWDQKPSALWDSWVGGVAPAQGSCGIEYGPICNPFDEEQAFLVEKENKRAIARAKAFFTKIGLDWIEILESENHFFGENSPYFKIKDFFCKRAKRKRRNRR